MYEYGIYNLETKEEGIIFGYCFLDALRRAHIEDDDNWVSTYEVYVD